MTHHASTTDESEAAKLYRRVKKNPFWSEAMKVLAHNNLHLHKPAFGHSGGVHVQVYFQTQKGAEVMNGFYLPNALKGFDSLGDWKHQFEREIKNFMKSRNLLPPRSTMEPVMATDIVTPPGPKFTARADSIVAEAEKFFMKPTPPEVVEVVEREETIMAEQVMQHEEFEEPSIATQEPVMEQSTPTNEQKVHVTIACQVDTLIALLGLNEGTVTVDDGRLVTVRLQTGISNLADFLTSISQSNANLITVSGVQGMKMIADEIDRPPNYQAMVYSVMTEGSHTLPIHVEEVKDRIRKKFSVKLDNSQISNALSLQARKGRLRGHGKGIYSVA